MYLRMWLFCIWTWRWYKELVSLWVTRYMYKGNIHGSHVQVRRMCSEETTLRNLDLECPASRTRREVLFYKPPKLSHFVIGQSSQSNTHVYLIDKQINDKVTSICSKLNFWHRKDENYIKIPIYHETEFFV